MCFYFVHNHSQRRGLQSSMILFSRKLSFSLKTDFSFTNMSVFENVSNIKINMLINSPYLLGFSHDSDFEQISSIHRPEEESVCFTALNTFY